MQGLAKLTAVELKLFFREPGAYFWTMIFPVVLLAILGSIPSFREPNPDIGGQRVIDLYVPIVVAMALATMTLFVTPTVIATYRQKGILRRLSTTPVGPVKVLVAQLVVQLAVAVATVTLVIATATIAFDAGPPRQIVGFVLAFVFTAAALLAIGLFIAAVVPSPAVGSGVGTALFFPLMFFAGLWVPREVMPQLLVRIGDYTPLGAATQALQDTSDGGWPPALALVVLAGYAGLAGLAAAKVFGWE